MKTLAMGFVLMVPCALPHTNNMSQRPHYRNLAHYDKAGPYNITLDSMGRGEGRQIEGQIRDWLWRYWMAKHRGYLQATRYSTEGEPSTSSYFIEPDKLGRWKIDVVIKRELTDRRNPTHKIGQRDEYAAYSVQRVEQYKSKTGAYLAIPNNSSRRGQDYLLLLSNPLCKSSQVI